MAASPPILNLCYFLIFLLIFGAYGINIQYFGGQNNSGLIWETHSAADCHNIPRNKWEYIRSIQTDTCFIAYNDSNCKSYRSIKYFAEDNYVPRDSLGGRIYIQSLHTCNEEEGSNQLNVDIIKHYWFARYLPDVFESYKNVCSCVNVPQYVQNKFSWSIDNHHNGLLAYYEPDCSEMKMKSTFIAAGANVDSFAMQGHHKRDQILNLNYFVQSFGPDPNSSYFQTSCNPTRAEN